MDELFKVIKDNDCTALADFIASGRHQCELHSVFGLILKVAEDMGHFDVISLLQEYADVFQIAQPLEPDHVAISNCNKQTSNCNSEVVRTVSGQQCNAGTSTASVIARPHTVDSHLHMDNECQNDKLNFGAELTVDALDITPINYYVGDCMDHLVKSEHFMLQKLFMLGLDENIRDSEGKGFIHHAATADSKDTLSLLIANGADADAKDLQRVTPLMMACRNSSLECVDLLLQHSNDLNDVDSCDQTALHHACKSDAVLCAKKLLERGIQFHLSMNRMSELMVALSHDAENVVEVLVQHGIDVNLKNRQHATALHHAAMYDCPAAIEHLSLVGAVIEADQHGYNAFAVAAKNGHHRVLKSLIKYYPHQRFLNLKTRNHKSPLQLAAGMGHYECIDLLLNAGASIDYGSDLCLAAQGGNHNILALFLKTYRERLGDNWYMTGLETDWSANKLQMSPLHIAAMYGYEDCVRLLLSEGANPCHTMPATGETPLMLAVIKNYHRCAKLIINAICKDRSVGLNSLTPKRKTALHYAATQGSLECAELLIRVAAAVDIKDSHGYTPMLLAVQGGHCDIVRLLLRANCDVTASKQYGWNGLHLAALNNYSECSECLLRAGLGPDVSSWISHVSPVQLAAKKGHTIILQILLEYRANVNHCDDMGLMPIHYAAKNDHANCIELLVLYRSPVDPIDKSGRTPAQLAAIQGHIKALALLILYNSDVSKISFPDEVCKAVNYIEAICLLFQVHGKFYTQDVFDASSKPRTLMQQCRAVIRGCMAQGIEFINDLVMLPLPKPLQTYISMAKECQNFASHKR